jgi:hypothetical protein
MSALHPVPRSEVLFYQHLGLPTPSLGLFTIFVSESKVGWFVSMSRTCTLNWLHVLNPGQVAWPAASLIRDFPSKKKQLGALLVRYSMCFTKICLRFLKTTFAWGFWKFHVVYPCTTSLLPLEDARELRLHTFNLRRLNCWSFSSRTKHVGYGIWAWKWGWNIKLWAHHQDWGSIVKSCQPWIVQNKFTILLEDAKIVTIPSRND